VHALETRTIRAFAEGLHGGIVARKACAVVVWVSRFEVVWVSRYELVSTSQSDFVPCTD
jgi:hypothetical protein